MNREIQTEGKVMKKEKSLKTIGAILIFAAVIAAGMLNNPAPVKAQGEGNNETEAARIRRGFAIAPIPLNLQHKDRNLVGLGSYWVNGAMDCNGCHSSGPAAEYTVPPRNPYFLSP